MSPGSVVMFRSVRDGNKRSSVEQCPGTGGRGAPCTEAGDPAGRSRRPCRPCPRQVPLTNHPGTAAPTVAPRELGRTLGRDGHLPPGPPPSVGIPHRTALCRGHAGDVGVPRRAGTGIAPVSRTPRSHARPGLTNGPVSRTALGVHTTRAHSHLQPMSADIVRQRLGGVPVDPVHGPVAAAGRRPARGVGPASMWHPGRGVGGTAGKTARPAACSAGLVGRRCVGGNAGPTFSASAAGRTRRRRGRPEPRSSARPWWLDWPVQRIV
jgi:hypothetical protein